MYKAAFFVKIRVLADLPVGENLQDHLNVPVSSPCNLGDLFRREVLFRPTTLLKYLWSGTGKAR